MPTTARDPDRLRTAELIATVCLATDVGMRFPLEHGFRATLMARRLCDLLDLDDETSNQVYYGSMLMYAGCTSDAYLGEQIVSGDRATTLIPFIFGSSAQRITSLVRSLPPADATPVQRVFETARRFPRLVAHGREQQAALCEVAETMSNRLGLDNDIGGLFTFLTERWDGNGMLRRAEGEDIPLAVRLFVLSRDFAYQRHIGGADHALETVRERAGHAFDPDLAEAILANADDLFASADVGDSAWSEILAAEPKPWNELEGDHIDRALGSIGDFADLISPWLAGHSAGLARLVAGAADEAGFDNDQTRDVRRAAYVHDVGRVAVSPEVWEKEGSLSRDEYEQVRLHPYHTERILSQSTWFAPIVAAARDHHERLDGSGYHRGVDASSLDSGSRLLAAADTYLAMTETRPHRPARPEEEAAKELAVLADDGRLDHGMVTAVIRATGQSVPEMERSGGLTDRETEVVGLLARGMQTKQIATALGISPKTVDTHIQSAYRKMGVSTRAAAAMYAMEHGLVPSGELPTHR